MTAFETVLVEHRPDCVIVVGDVNSTVACALVCAKLGVRVAHVEAGLRSRDRTMPEEINRVVTDQISDILFTPSEDANANLLSEGIDSKRIHFVGNVMIDTLVKMLPKAAHRQLLRDLGYSQGEIVLVTLHRPSNVDDPATLREILLALVKISKRHPVLFPLHPRTRNRIEGLGVALPNTALRLMEPLGYLDFLALMASARLIITDSGGVQEESTFLGVPCLTARPNTERPVTVTSGTNRLVASRYEELVKCAQESLAAPIGPVNRPALWDGQTARRIVQVLQDL